MRSLLLGAALVALTSPAFAATFITGAGGPAVGISIGADIFVSDPVKSSDGITAYTYTFTALEDLEVIDFGVAGSGPNADLLDITFNLDFLAPPPATWTEFSATGTSAVGAFSNFYLSAMDSFTLTFYAEADTNANISAFFDTRAVPVPAALPLMFGALGALGVAGYRRKATA